MWVQVAAPSIVRNTNPVCDEDSLRAGCVAQWQEGFDEAVDVDRLYSLWSTIWEQYLRKNYAVFVESCGR